LPAKNTDWIIAQKPGEIDDFLNAFNEMSFADSIFTGDRFIKPDGSHTPEQVLLRMAQARHEQINERFKEFGILTQRFRNDRAWHPTVVNAIANVVQLQLWFERPPMDIRRAIRRYGRRR